MQGYSSDQSGQMKRPSSAFAGGAVAFALFFSIASMGYAQSTLERAKADGSVRIAIANAQPYAGINPDGTVSGAAPEIAIAVLKKMGISNVEPTIVEYGAMIPGLQANRFDIVTAGLDINPERCAVVIYSEPDVCSTWSLAVKSGNPLGLKSLADIAGNPQVKVSVCGGCSEQNMLLEAGVSSEQIIVATDEQGSFKLLQDGRIDAYPYPTSSINALMAKANDPNIEMTGLLPDVRAGCAGAAFRQSDRDFRDEYDAALKSLKESGELEAILAKYGFAAEPAKSMTREQLCEAPN